MKVSVSRNMLVLVVVAVALLAFGVLMIVFYMGAVNKTSQLEDEIQQMKVTLATMDEPDITGLKEQIEKLEEQIANDAPFPAGPFDEDSKYDNKRITNAIFEVADDAYVSLDSLSHSKASEQQIGSGNYRADSFSLKCSVIGEGDGGRLIDFLELLEELREDEYPTMVMDGVKFPGGGDSLQFDLAIITQTFEE